MNFKTERDLEMTTDRKKAAGHILALLTITVWGTTFVATKTLLNHYDALQIMLMRFFIAWVVLMLFTRKVERPQSVKEELGIFALSLSGITLYYYFENTALLQMLDVVKGTSVTIGDLELGSIHRYIVQRL